MKDSVKINIINQLLGHGVTIVSGKIFKNQIEISEQELYNEICTFNGGIVLDTDFKAIYKTLLLTNKPDYWYPLPIIEEAKKVKNIEPLAFPLTHKQLIIINRLLFHPADEIMFITTGIGGSGKSTFLNIIKQLFANDYITIPLSQLSGFALADATSHRLICSDEIGAKDLDSDVLKQMISKQSIYVNKKYAGTYQAKCQAALFYCCNKAPIIDISDTGLLRRIVYYERNEKIVNPNVLMKEHKFTYSELLAIAHAAWLTESDTWRDEFKDETRKYLLKNNSVYQALNHANKYFNRSDISYKEYTDICKIIGKKPYSMETFEEIKLTINTI